MKKYALVVGVSRYDDPEIGNLNFAAEDAREVGNCLTEICGFDEVQTLVSGGEREPDHISVVEALNRFAPILNPDDLFLFYFAGHGIHTANGSFLLASNSRIRMPELAAVPMPLLQQCLSRLDAAERVLILDACRNDPHQGRGDSDNVLTQEFSRDILAVAKAPCEGAAAATCVLFSCSEGERAYEWQDKRHGAFTWYLLDGLRGAALDPQGRLTIQGLSRYVEEQVPRWSHKAGTPHPQTPWAQQMGSLREICLSPGECSRLAPLGGGAKDSHLNHSSTSQLAKSSAGGSRISVGPRPSLTENALGALMTLATYGDAVSLFGEAGTHRRTDTKVIQGEPFGGNSLVIFSDCGVKLVFGKVKTVTPDSPIDRVVLENGFAYKIPPGIGVGLDYRTAKKRMIDSGYAPDETIVLGEVNRGSCDFSLRVPPSSDLLSELTLYFQKHKVYAIGFSTQRSATLAASSRSAEGTVIEVPPRTRAYIEQRGFLFSKASFLIIESIGECNNLVRAKTEFNLSQLGIRNPRRVDMSPDRRRVLFFSGKTGISVDGGSLHIMSCDGTDMVCLKDAEFYGDRIRYFRSATWKSSDTISAEAHFDSQMGNYDFQSVSLRLDSHNRLAR